MMNGFRGNSAIASAAIVLGVLVFGRPLFGAINLELRPHMPTAVIGESFEIDLFAVSDDPNNDQAFTGVQIILMWEPQRLQLTGQTSPAPTQWIFSGFLDDSQIDGVNDSLDDGNAYYQAASTFPGPAWATPEGLLVTTFSFLALSETANTQILIAPSIGQNTVSAVFSDVPGVEVTGTLGSANVEILGQFDWGLLRIDSGQNPPCTRAGDEVSVELTALNLVESVNGAQALLQYDAGELAFLELLPGDGMGSPWDGAAPAHADINGGMAVALFLLGGATSTDATVGRVRFVALTDIALDSPTLRLVPQVLLLESAFTVASTGVIVIPDLAGEVALPALGDTENDRDIDLIDFGDLVACAAGPDALPNGTCGCFDFDGDSDVDMLDFAELQHRFTPAP